MAIAKLAGRTKMVGTRILGSPQGAPPFHRIGEVHFPSREVLEACAASEGGKQTIAHAVSISSGGVPIILVAEAETLGIDERELPFIGQLCGKCLPAARVMRLTRLALRGRPDQFGLPSLKSVFRGAV
jgi:hypothetical protein